MYNEILAENLTEVVVFLLFYFLFRFMNGYFRLLF